MRIFSYEMPRRVRGYHYVRGANGRKRRVYGGRRTRGRARSSVNSRISRMEIENAYGGYGSYRRLGRGSKARMGSQAPKVINSSGKFIVQHTEYLGDLASSAAFVNNGFFLNPGIQAGTEGGFTNWLPKLAANFEQWKPRGIVFFFKSTSSDAVLSTAANSALGTISMATDYNVLNGLFGNKLQMENYEYSSSCKPSTNMQHFVECARKQTPVSELYIRTSAVPAGADQRLYDLGVFQLASSGQQVAGGVLGELWVSYEIELLKPRIPVGQVDDSVVFDHIQITAATALPATPFGTSTTVPQYPSTESTLGGVVTGGAVTAVSFAPQKSPTGTNFVGGINVLDANGNPTGAQGAATANTYYFPPGVSSGNFMIQYNAKWGVTGVPANPVFTLTNCAVLNLMNTDATSLFVNDSSANTTTTLATQFITISKANAKFSIVGSAGATTPTWGDLFVVELPAVIN